MSERLHFIARLEEGERATELAREFGISTKTAYKFWSRWKTEGVDGLKDRSMPPIEIGNILPTSSSSRSSPSESCIRLRRA